MAPQQPRPTRHRTGCSYASDAELRAGRPALRQPCRAAAPRTVAASATGTAAAPATGCPCASLATGRVSIDHRLRPTPRWPLLETAPEPADGSRSCCAGGRGCAVHWPRRVPTAPQHGRAWHRAQQPRTPNHGRSTSRSARAVPAPATMAVGCAAIRRRQAGYKEYHEMINIMQVAESHDKVLRKNFISQLPGISVGLEFNVSSYKIVKPI
ncbi:hypothetical protein E2562_001883 [Oryza meyeriana var. granulata]|uniref:Uncharacterized protein n=1 Tax=Oryza meyeriana var. granulata TaxID=110450 RepID=A0A6G1C4U6_9ORYZ|nr:hypothetical protein E2562_001883 [Oryza meyeriana var. granulata]